MVKYALLKYERHTDRICNPIWGFDVEFAGISLEGNCATLVAFCFPVLLYRWLYLFFSSCKMNDVWYRGPGTLGMRWKPRCKVLSLSSQISHILSVGIITMTTSPGTEHKTHRTSSYVKDTFDSSRIHHVH